MTHHRICTRNLTPLVPLVEQKMLTLPEYFSWSPVFSGVRVHVQFQVVMFLVRCCNINCNVGAKRCSVGPYTHLFCWGSCFIRYLYEYFYTTRFPYEIVSVSLYISTMGEPSETQTTFPSGAPEFTPR